MRSRAAAAATATSAQYGELPDAGLRGDRSEAPASSVSLAASGEPLGEIQEIHMTRKIFHMLWVRAAT
jgi:hypothetical protein